MTAFVVTMDVDGTDWPVVDAEVVQDLWAVPGITASVTTSLSPGWDLLPKVGDLAVVTLSMGWDGDTPTDFVLMPRSIEGDLIGGTVRWELVSKDIMWMRPYQDNIGTYAQFCVAIDGWLWSGGYFTDWLAWLPFADDWTNDTYATGLPLMLPGDAIPGVTETMADYIIRCARHMNLRMRVGQDGTFYAYKRPWKVGTADAELQTGYATMGDLDAMLPAAATMDDLDDNSVIPGTSMYFLDLVLPFTQAEIIEATVTASLDDYAAGIVVPADDGTEVTASHGLEYPNASLTTVGTDTWVQVADVDGGNGSTPPAATTAALADAQTRLYRVQNAGDTLDVLARADMSVTIEDDVFVRVRDVYEATLHVQRATYSAPAGTMRLELSAVDGPNED